MSVFDRASVVALCAVAALACTAGVDREAALRNREANAAYEQQQWDEAARLYGEALTRAPEVPDLSYNLGNALHRLEKYEDAAAALARAAQSGDPVLRQRSLYNLGNTFVRMGKLPEAIDAYRRSLALDPTDRDAKINLEKALRMQQQQQEQQQQQQQQQQQDPQQQDPQQNQEQQDPQQQNQDQQGDGEQQPPNDDSERQPPDESNPDQQDSEEPDQDPSEPQPQDAEPQEARADSLSVAEGEMRPEEAQRILDAMLDQEKELQKEKARKVRARARRVEKDW